MAAANSCSVSDVSTACPASVGRSASLQRPVSINDGRVRQLSAIDLLSNFGATGDDDSQLGFANLPDQVHRKAVKKGFNFTLMVVGESGLGKSTLVSSLLHQDLYNDRTIPTATERITQTTRVEKRHIELDEKGVKLRLTILDTPGFSDPVNCNDCWKPIEDYVDGAFESYFKDECGLNRKNIQDNRVHCCLYFVSPYGWGLRQLDVEFMRRLHNKVNIVPVIAKADCLTAGELRDLKDRVMADLDRHKINIYRMPECDSDEEEEIRKLDAEIRKVLPFAVIGSTVMVDTEGRKVRGRQYPWGVVEMDSGQHCDFTKLRLFLLKTHMQDLKDMTRDVHYENYRAKYITERMNKRHERRDVPAQRPEREQNSGPAVEPVIDADALLRQKEEELQRMKALVNQMQTQLAKTPVLQPRSASNASNSGSTNSTPIQPRQ